MRDVATARAYARSAARRLAGAVPGGRAEAWQWELTSRRRLREAPRGPEPGSPSDDPVARPGPLPPVAAGATSVVLLLGTPGNGGATAAAAFLARGMAARGLRVSLWHNGPATDPGTCPAPLRGLDQVGVDLRPVARGQLASRLREVAADVVSAHAPAGWMVREAATAGVPVVQTLHRSLLLPDGEEAVDDPFVTLVVAVSETARCRYLRACPDRDPAAVHVIPNGLAIGSDLPPREASRRWLGLGDEPLLLALGRFSSEKNPLGVIRAFARVAAAHADARLLMVGDVADPLLLLRARTLLVRDPARARVHVRRHSDRVPALLAAADGLVLDSFVEGWPLASMEAIRAGLPVVMSDVGGAREQLGPDGGRGHLVPNPAGGSLEVDWATIARLGPRRQVNEDELVRAVLAVLDDRNVWAARRPALVESARALFAPDECVDSHVRVHVTAAAASGTPAALGAVRTVRAAGRTW